MQDQFQALKLQMERSERRFRIFGGLALAVIAVSLLLVSRPPVTAQNGGQGLDSRVTALEARVSALQTALNQEIANRSAADQALSTRIDNIQLTPGPAGPQGPKGDTGAAGATGPAGASPFVLSGDGTTYVLSGYNLQIVSGNGATDEATNGRGNLIIGYNENDFGYDRTGSHNLVVGGDHGYSSYGGLVAGRSNQISAPFSSISGGSGNITGGYYASISGGSGNFAAYGASVSGGNGNFAYGNNSSIIGGAGNIATGSLASISGGGGNIAGGDFASISGGGGNIAGGDYSSVSGGYNNLASGRVSSVSGGVSNAPNGGYDVSGIWDGVGPTWWGAGVSGH